LAPPSVLASTLAVPALPAAVVVVFTTTALVVGVVSIATASPGLLGIEIVTAMPPIVPPLARGCSARDRQGAGAEKDTLAASGMKEAPTEAALVSLEGLCAVDARQFLFQPHVLLLKRLGAAVE
jgi:hypothetical protein